MDSPFPFGLPGPTAFYLVIYVLALVVHVLFMNYVLAGSLYLAGSALTRGGNLKENALANMLRDWLPFMLGLAITAGVGPLLFVQILYQKQFYTANLLLFHRWMAILPILIVGFYLLYLLKSDFLVRGRNWRRWLIAPAACACFVFIAWSWTENHLLALAGQSTWVKQYGLGKIWYQSVELAPRLAMWVTGAFSTLALLLAWQLRLSFPNHETAPGAKRTSLLGIAGLIAGMICAATYYQFLQRVDRSVFTSAVAWPYLAAAILGVLLQVAGWSWQFRSGQLRKSPLVLCSVGWALMALGVSVLREVLRLNRLDLAELTERHRQAAEVGGFTLFVLCLIICGALIGYAVFLVRRSSAESGHSDQEE